MKAITIWQPWAEFVAAGVKHNETRSWATKYRGPIAIHAAVKPIRQVVPLLSEKAFGLMVEKLEKASTQTGASSHARAAAGSAGSQSLRVK